MGNPSVDPPPLFVGQGNRREHLLQHRPSRYPLPVPYVMLVGVVSLAFRLPNASQQRVSRRFLLTAPCNCLHDFVAQIQNIPLNSITISTSFPRKVSGWQSRNEEDTAMTSLLNVKHMINICAFKFTQELPCSPDTTLESLGLIEPQLLLLTLG